MVQRRTKLISLRKSHHYTQKYVVELLKEQHDIEITESYYGMIEQGVRTPSLSVALAITELFNADPNEIFFKVKPNEILGDVNSSKEAI
ncbi:helix-turn-helix transcriptional regulator [Caldibacillus lycopersici]|uniref:Helix-turn-helix transcriptional regulator n=1 Tax=Perspicuibacillus lycopersici TaxID=1325689 RepID=A0AAE3LNQ1_9BACI|nr:helix-turn-helix transcriptional regulator [Perspicuibacillus lycopersici]MCU9614126.1 helix-turn-helix transcriptional regulator [Perspicuibacillus lycopersici]